MPVHDWTRVEAGVFHDFHFGWIAEFRRVLNSGLLPPDYYALAEQIAGGREPDVIRLQRPSPKVPEEPAGGVAVATRAPQVRYRMRADVDRYAAKAKAIVIRHTSNHRVVAMIEVVSPGNKSSRHALREFVQKAVDMLRAGIHLLIVDLFPPSPRDPQAIHKAVWDEVSDDDFTLPANRRLTLVGYIGGRFPEAFIEPMAVGMSLPEMPLFLTADVYVPVPLETTYHSAWEAVPAYWREVLESATPKKPRGSARRR